MVQWNTDHLGNSNSGKMLVLTWYCHEFGREGNTREGKYCPLIFRIHNCYIQHKYMKMKTNWWIYWYHIPSYQCLHVATGQIEHWLPQYSSVDSRKRPAQHLWDTSVLDLYRCQRNRHLRTVCPLSQPVQLNHNTNIFQMAKFSYVIITLMPLFHNSSRIGGIRWTTNF